MKLFVATRSAGKAREIRQLLLGSTLTPVFPDERRLPVDPEEARLERGATYAENAIAKARWFARRSGLPTAADDSGLEVDVLGGAPGVASARWARARDAGLGTEEGWVEAENNRVLLERLRDVPTQRRTARYRCVVAYVATSDAAPLVTEGVCEGRILEAPRGSGGFGYDPLFWSRDLGETFAEAAAEAKHRVSHRGRAFRALAQWLRAQP
jgi:XTP/dITP diphosphohydrolase